MSDSLTRAALAGSGVILGAVGSSIMFAPQIFLATSEAIVEHDPNLLSEVTAPSGLLVVAGAFMMLSALKLRFANLGLICGSIVYGTYGLSRLISMQLHGFPSDTLVVVTWFELGIAALLLGLSLKGRQAKSVRQFSSFDREVTQ